MYAKFLHHTYTAASILGRVTMRLWGALEFALTDSNGVE